MLRMKKIPIKLIVCDIDDTLIHKDLHLSDSIRQVIENVKDSGIKFTLATGRMPYRAEVFAKEARLDIPYIANNGSILFDRGRMICCKLLNARLLQKNIQYIMEQNPEFTVIFSYLDRECPLVRSRWVEERLHTYKGYDQILGNTDDVWNQEVHKVYVLDDSRSGLIGRLALELEDMNGDFSFFRYGEYSIEIVGKGCSKASGLKTLLNYLNLSAEQVMFIGDHTNDIEIVQMAGVGVAVANADPKLKAVADFITSKERAEGVEEAIKKFVLD